MKATCQDALDLLIQGSITLAKMEANGVRIDLPYLETAIAKVTADAKLLQTELRQADVYQVWRREYGEKTNLGSKVQLGWVLFDLMKVPHPVGGELARTEKDKRWRTSEDVIDLVDHPFCRSYTKLGKLTGLKARLVSLRNETVDGRLHSNWNLHLARSYRSSSGRDKESEGKGEFNFQNIYHREEWLAEIIRKVFVPSPGCLFVEADMAAHEFRIAAAVWQDPEMIRYVKEGKDIHRELAARMFLCKQSQVSGPMRHLGKNGFVFPVLYGSYHVQVAANVWRDSEGTVMADGETKLRDWLRGKGIAERGNCDPKSDPRPGTFERHVKGVEKWFMEKFKVFAGAKERTVAEYRKRGWFNLVTGFHCSGVYSNNAVLNYQVQGPAFHCVLLILIEAQRRLRKCKMKTKLVGTIHDSIEADSPEKETTPFLDLVTEVACGWLPKQWPWITVPLGVEAKVGESNWHGSVTWERSDDEWGPKTKAA